MKNITPFLLACSISLASPAQPIPTLKHYDQQHLLNISLPLGGIGTGTVSLGGRGELRDWSIMNKPGIGFSTITDGNQAPFFAIYVAPRNQKPMTKALLGPLHPSEFMHYEGRPVNHHGLPRFSSASFDAAYPFGQVNLSDATLPVTVKITGFNPFIPGDIPASSIPIAILRYEVTNTSKVPMEVSVCGTLRNFIGIDGTYQSKNWKGDMVYDGARYNQNQYRSNAQVRGLYMYSDSVNHKDPAWGTMALVSPDTDGTLSYRRSSRNNDWENALLDFWDDFSSDGLLTDKKELVDHNPMGSLALKKAIPAGGSATFTFYLTWHFPNRLDWNNSWNFNYRGNIVGNYYTQQYSDAWNVLEKEAARLGDLEKMTRRFVKAFLESAYPPIVKEAALFNLSTLRSQTVFRLPSGHLMGWEGVMNENGSCYGNCTHVWNYETATAFLFGDLARSMRDVELDYGTKDNGKMMNRVSLPLDVNLNIDHVAAADGQMGSIIRAYREWKLSGDMDWLRRHWPRLKAAMQYAWIKGGWDEDADGVEEGEQHNTMDVNYYGPNPQMQFWYFGALKATAEMARAMNEPELAEKCIAVFKKGSAWVEQHLFNDSYYEHKITDPVTRQFIDLEKTDALIPVGSGPQSPLRETLRGDGWGKVPEYQLGPGCLVDQLAGQYMAHVVGLGYLGDSAHMRTALQTVMKNNYIERFDNVFNNMRSYVMDREGGLIMASWPRGRLKVPFPYFAESMSGFEYTAGIGMLYEGQTANGLKVLTAIRNRYDGEKRNPFDEPECGHHYARAMASWSATLALSGFQYSAIDHSMAFTYKPGTYFWSNGYSWGTCKIMNGSVKLEVIKGSVVLDELRIGKKVAKLKGRIVKADEVLNVRMSQ